jgi:chromosome segregation ATPase
VFRNREAEMSQPQSSSKADNAAPSVTPTVPPSTGFDPLAALGDVEKSLQGLKKLYEERRELETRLAEAQGVINQRQTELATMQAALEAETNRAEETADQLASLREETKAQLAQARKERDALEAKSLSIESRQAELEKQIAEQRSLVEVKQAELEESTKAIAAKAKQDIEKARGEAEAARAAAQAQVEKVQAEASSARTESDRTKTIAAELESFAAELNTLQKELDEGKVTLDADRAKLIEAVDRIKAREEELNARDAEIASKQAALGDRDAAAEQKARDEARQQARAQAEAERAELESRIKAESDAAEQMRKDLESVVRRCAAQEEVLAEYEQLLSVERSHVHALMDRIQREGAGADEIESSLVELRQCLAAERDARASAVSGSEQSLQQLADAAAKVRAAEEKAANLEKELAAAKTHQAKQQHTIERLNAAKSGGMVPASGSMSTLRRKRLTRYRSILREQVDKVRRASEVLAKRFEQCEQVLGMRAEVMAAKRQVENAAARVQRQASTKQAAALTLYCVLILGTLAALSWAAVNQVLPGTFAAATELVADGRGRELSDAERDEWKRALEETLADPRFIDLVADRMRQRGYDKLATGNAMKSFLTTNFSHESPSPGSLKLEVRADGRDRAARSLDIIATALASDANANRERRADGAVTLIKSPALAGERPVDDTRLSHAGILLGVSSLLTLGFGTLLWGRLAKAKTDFEMGSQIDQVLDEARWSEFTAATTNKRPNL